MEVYLPNTHPKLGSFRVKRECCVFLTVNIVYLRTSQRKMWESAASVAGIVRTYITGAQKGGRSKREVCPFQKAITRMMIMLKQTNNFRTRRVDGSDVDIISNKLTLLYCPYSSATALISAFFAILMYFNQELIIF